MSKVLIKTVSVLENTYTSGQSALATASARKDEALHAVSTRKQAAVEQIKSIADTNPVVKAGRAVVHQGVEKFDHLVTASKSKLQEYPAVQTGLDRIETAYEAGKEKLAQSKTIVRDSIEQGRAKLHEREQKVRGIVHRIREDVTETVPSCSVPHRDHPRDLMLCLCRLSRFRPQHRHRRSSCWTSRMRCWTVLSRSSNRNKTPLSRV